jgi:hypothetical protein
MVRKGETMNGLNAGDVVSMGWQRVLIESVTEQSGCASDYTSLIVTGLVLPEWDKATTTHRLVDLIPHTEAVAVKKRKAKKARKGK